MRFRALAFVLAVVTVWIAPGCGGGDDESIELPKAAQETGSAPTGTTDSTPEERKRDTVTVKLFTGEEVRISLQCSIRLDIRSQKNEAVAAARRLPSLKQRLLDRRRDYKAFLRQNPEQELPASAYERYRTLKAAYKSSLTAYNRQIRVFNRLADRYNAALKACRV